ncbi:MAG: anthranilate synthase family protein [Micromonosporaceae bacterium]
MTEAPHRAVSDSVDSGQPFCLWHAAGRTRIATGAVTRVPLLAELPRPGELPVISMVPYTQLRERGFVLHDEGEPILALVPDEVRDVDLDTLLDGPEPAFGTSGVGFDLGDEEFADRIGKVISEEICRGEGSNFLLSRHGYATIQGFDATVAKVILRRLVRNDPDAYLGFCFFDGERYFIGSSPERHVTVHRGEVVMNPICGTLPKSTLTKRADLIEFLTDPKEINELFQVVDEELKMMSRICGEGGTIRGPYLKEMGAVVHTEYELVGHSRLDPVDIFRDTMFAATMIGSPLENAARIIHKYEDASRRYYSSAIVIHERDEAGEERLDSAITIRTMEVTPDGRARLQSGGSIVRDSEPAKEARECQAKIEGLLHAVTSAEPRERQLPQYSDRLVMDILQLRNKYLSRFWTQDQEGSRLVADAPGKSILVIDNEDEFTYMLRHVLSHLGYDVTIRDYDDPSLRLDGTDLVLVGPGPGDPLDLDDPKIRRVHEIVAELRASGTRFLAVCLGHQVLCNQLGMDVVAVDPPLQGVQETVDLYGRQEPVGFYNTFFAVRPEVAPEGVQIAAEPDGWVIALRSERFASFQFHVESVLTSNSATILREALELLH